MAPQGPYKLVTVNNAPERAQRLIGRVVADVKDKYTIIHAANCEDISPEAVSAIVKDVQPDLLFTASMWTPEQSDAAHAAARSAAPGIRTFALPQGLQVERGPDAVVDFIKEHLPGLLEGAEADGPRG
ncbi:uncharacterized protein K452DRAFT_321641 [Aplosporella prunicola CBS 121167]|uniref:Uncharacterized protein n=1 Tax=Aplosporella prunicola CBS 121167 TaxID=1176127 RepID=A0A6A6B162_9PEZI|nr:uncharacterized protein K452DRAFT_321641 [Aplosporella prunicola CBS 121167]KAF2137586.1 hypothetical protein K452DRAFT_321641 [Aplosporella prunicola CBS 121167]